MYLIVSGPYEGRKIRWVWGEGGGQVYDQVWWVHQPQYPPG